MTSARSSSASLPPLEPAVPVSTYPCWRSVAHALIDGARSWRDCRRLRRTPPGAIGIGAVVHAEALGDPRVYPLFHDLCRFFRRATGTRMLACVVPGGNPIVRGLMRAHGLTPAAYLDRIRMLAADAEIGYHGHFFVRQGSDGLAPMRHANFDADVFRWQLDDDLEWFRALGTMPRCYTGGWWVLNDTILTSLAAGGIRYDFTLRPTRRNTFGETYDVVADALDGRPCRVTGGIWEMASFAGLWRYPGDTAAWTTAATSSAPPPPFFGLFFHDYDLLTYRPALERMILTYSRMPFLGWASFERLGERLAS